MKTEQILNNQGQIFRFKVARLLSLLLIALLTLAIVTLAFVKGLTFYYIPILILSLVLAIVSLLFIMRHKLSLGSLVIVTVIFTIGSFVLIAEGYFAFPVLSITIIFITSVALLFRKRGILIGAFLTCAFYSIVTFLQNQSGWVDPQGHNVIEHVIIFMTIVFTISFFLFVFRKEYDKQLKKESEFLATTKKALSRSEKLYQAIVEDQSEFICRVTPDFKLTFANDAFFKFFKLDKSVVGTKFQILLSPAQRKFVDKKKAEISFKKPLYSFEHSVTIDNKVKWLNWNVRGIFDNNKSLIEIQSVGRDITLQKEIELKMLEAKQLAEQSVAAKEEFVSNVSHEIRTPLNILIGMNYLLGRTELNSEQQSYLASLNKSAKDLLEIINNILDFSQIEAKKVEFNIEKIEIKKFLEEFINNIRFKAKENNLELFLNIDQDVPEIIYGDIVKLNQILLNLVGNAIKFTKEGFIQINLKLEKMLEDKAKLKFEVNDTGIGIAEDKITEIFQDFKQVYSDINKKHKGTGLGLTIVKKLVELQGGQITVTSKLNSGSHFSFILDFIIKAEDINSHKSVDIGTHELNKANILVADDNEVSGLLMEKLLTTWGAKVKVVSNGKEVIEDLEQNKIDYDLILMDLRMPVMDGYETTDYIKKHLKGKAGIIPIIAFSANNQPLEFEKVLKVGMNDYMSKPFNPDQLYLKIKKLIYKNKVLTNLLGKEYLNVKLLDKTQAEQREFFLKILQSFKKQISESIPLFKHYYQAKNWDGIFNEAHKIKPSTYYLDSKVLQENIKKIQELASAPNLAKKKQLITAINNFEAEFKKIITELENG